MWGPPVTVNDPDAPVTVPTVVVPSPQSMLAVKEAAVSRLLLSLNVATCVLAGTAAPSLMLIDAPETGARPMSAVLPTLAKAVASGLFGSSVTVTEIASWPFCV